MSVSIIKRSGGAGTFTVPTVQTFLSGSGTYTRPTPAPLYLKVKMVGGGGGGDSSGTVTPSSSATAGTDTTFGTALLEATGGAAGVWGTFSSFAGGTASVSAPAISIFTSQGGGSGPSQFTDIASTAELFASDGASSIFGGEGRGGSVTNVGTDATGYGSGGGGGGSQINQSSNFSGPGGAAGGYLEAIIPSPAATYSYTVGTGGIGGVPMANGFDGGAGGDGIIIVEEYYQ